MGKHTTGGGRRTASARTASGISRTAANRFIQTAQAQTNVTNNPPSINTRGIGTFDTRAAAEARGRVIADLLNEVLPDYNPKWADPDNTIYSSSIAITQNRRTRHVAVIEAEGTETVLAVRRALNDRNIKNSYINRQLQTNLGVFKGFIIN